MGVYAYVVSSKVLAVGIESRVVVGDELLCKPRRPKVRIQSLLPFSSAPRGSCAPPLPQTGALTRNALEVYCRSQVSKRLVVPYTSPHDQDAERKSAGRR
jgi:hypothetical protein